MMMIMIEVGVLVCYYYCRKKRIEELLCWWLWLLHGLLDSLLDCLLHCLCGFMVGVDCWINAFFALVGCMHACFVDGFF
jgi:hypothetical protein